MCINAVAKTSLQRMKKAGVLLHGLPEKWVSTNSHRACDANGPSSSWTCWPHTVLKRTESLSCEEITLRHLAEYRGGQELGEETPGLCTHLDSGSALPSSVLVFGLFPYRGKIM